MFKLIRVANYAHLQKWVQLNPDSLALQEDKTGITLTIEIETGLQIQIWGSDENILVIGVNHVAGRLSPERPKTKVIEKRATFKKIVTAPYPVGAKPGQGYTVTSDGGFQTFVRIHYDNRSRRFKP